MLSSLILSMAMSMSPATAIDTNDLQVQEVSRRRGSLRISEKGSSEPISRRRGSLRISEKGSSEPISRRRGSLRI